jgi:molecular chaperone DnaK
MGGVMTALIPRNTTIPSRKTEIFSTAEDSQTAVDIHVLQGERPMARDNKSLGQFRLDGIPPAPRGVPQIEVTFDIDANGILDVTAKDKATGKEQRIEITASTNLTESDVERMVREAKQHEAEDRRQRELAEARNQADQLIYTVEKTLRELGDRVSAADRGRVESLINDLKTAIAGQDVTRIRDLIEQLQQATYALSQQLYQTQQQAQSGGPQPTAQDGDVVEGEFEEI